MTCSICDAQLKPARITALMGLYCSPQRPDVPESRRLCIRCAEAHVPMHRACPNQLDESGTDWCLVREVA